MNRLTCLLYIALVLFLDLAQGKVFQEEVFDQIGCQQFHFFLHYLINASSVP